jgi:hypothetical protein
LTEYQLITKLFLYFTNEAAAGFQEIDYGNGAMEVNPDDIESVSVLKGQVAAFVRNPRQMV